jgi:SpoVK/Ycf46/Vps4 family AAA+-type ATPase
MLYSAIEYSMMPAVLDKVENQVKLAYITPRGDICNQEIKFNDIIDEESVKANYNDDLPYDKLKEILSNDGKALLMFYGEAGTGKTTLIKHFINKIYKNFIFFDANLIMSISNIGLINFLMENTDSVIIFEDCEKIIKSREASDNPFISTLLNLTDGIIADAFRCKFICTFNTSINEVDKALLRKGRLTLQYEFKKLSLDKTKALKPDATSPMTLADIYNEEDNGTKVKGKIGF